MIAGAGDHEMEGEAGEGSHHPLNERTDAEKIQQVRDLYTQEHMRADRLEQEIEALKKGKRLGHDPLRRLGP